MCTGTVVFAGYLRVTLKDPLLPGLCSLRKQSCGSTATDSDMSSAEPRSNSAISRMKNGGSILAKRVVKSNLETEKAVTAYRPSFNPFTLRKKVVNRSGCCRYSRTFSK